MPGISVIFALVQVVLYIKESRFASRVEKVKRMENALKKLAIKNADVKKVLERAGII